MQDAIEGLRYMGPMKMTIVMMILAVLVVIPIMRLISRKTPLVERILLCFLVVSILWCQWWLASI